MSAPESPLPASEDASAPTDPTPNEPAIVEAKRRSRARRWAVFFFKLLVYTTILLAILRLSAPLYLPTVLSASANQLGFELVYEDLDLGVWDGTFVATKVQLLPIEGGEPIATVKRVEARVRLQELREGRLIYEQVTITGLDGVLVVDEDGVLALQKRVEKALYGDGPRTKGSGNDEFLIYEEMIVKDSQIRWIDRSVDPPVDEMVRIALTARDWNSIKKPYWPEQLDATLGSPARPDAATLTSAWDGDQTTIRLRIKGLDSKTVEGYVRDAGWKTDAEALDVDVGWRTRVAQGDKPREVRLEDIHLAVEGREVLSLKTGEFTPRWPEEDLDLGVLELAGLKISVVREPDGLVRWSTFERVPPPPKQPDDGATTVQGIHVQGSHVRFLDRTLSPQHTVAFGVRELTVGASGDGPAQAVPFEADLFVPHGAGSIALVGSYTEAGGGTAVTARVDAQRASGRVLAPYLEPYGVEPALERGRVAFDVEAGHVVLDGAALRPWLRVRGFELVPEAGSPLRCDALIFEGRRVDEARRDYRFADVQLRGLEADVVRNADGTQSWPGLRVLPWPEGESQPSRFEAEALFAQVRRLKVLDARRPDAPTFTFRDLRLRSNGPFVLDELGLDPNPTLDFEVRGEVAPLASSCVVLAHVKRPLEPDVHVELEVTLSGLRGQALVDLSSDDPRLRSDTLRDGVFQAGIQADRRPVATGEPGSAWTIQVHGASLRTRPGAKPVASLDSAQLEIERLDAESGVFDASSLQLNGPRLSLRRSDAGLHCLGLLRVPPEEGVEPEEPARDRDVPLRGVRTLRISNGQLDYRDVRAEPHARVPVRGIDLEVSGLSNHAYVEARPVRFRGTARAGLVPLPWRKQAPKGSRRSKLLEWVTFGQIKRDVEERTGLQDRPAFSDLELSGNLVLAPEPKGTARLDLQRLELAVFRGIAKENDVQLRYGRLHVDTTATFLGDGRTRLESNLLFHKLSVEEPLGGVVGQTIGVPLTPLSAVIAVLEDSDDAIRVPVTVTVDSDGLVSKKTYQVVLGALPAVIGEKLKRTPLSVGGAVAGFGKTLSYLVPKPVRKLFEGKKEIPLHPQHVAFAPGSSHLAPAERLKLAPIAKHLKKGARIELTLEHTLSEADAERVAARVNPEPRELRAVLGGLERKLRELFVERARLHAEAEAALDGDDADALERGARAVRELDQVIGDLERARDGVWTALAERSNWDTRRRTREACKELGEQRIRRLREALLEFGVPNLSARLKSQPPRYPAEEGAVSGVRIQPTLARDE